MASNFDSIGLGVSNETALGDLVVRLASAAKERLVTDAGEYAIWRSRTGAELWVHLGPVAGGDDAEREIIGVTPFFEGRSEVVLNLDAVLKRPDDNGHEGAFQGWVCHDSDDDLGAYSLIFDAVDFAAHENCPLPTLRHVRLTGFARAIVVCDDTAVEGQVPAAEPGQRSFCSTGTITGEQSPQANPGTGAYLTGKVTDFACLVNEATGEPFTWLLVDSWLASFDIVAAPPVISGTISVGATVQVDCAMFGRIID